MPFNVREDRPGLELLGVLQAGEQGRQGGAFALGAQLRQRREGR